MHRWLPWYWYEAAYLVGNTLMTLGFSLRTEGRGNVPARGPVLVVANHESFIDPLLVGLATRRHLRAVARKTLYRHRALAALIRSLEAIPLDQEGVGKEGLRAVLEELGGGGGVLIFPEGSRTRDGRIHALKPGIHLLLRRARVPVVPVGIAGAYQAWPIWRKYPLPAPLFLPANDRCIAVSVGQPLDGRRFAGLPREQALGELLRELQRAAARAERLRRKP